MFGAITEITRRLIGLVCVCRNSNRLGNGVLYASVNPEYISAAESKDVNVFPAFATFLLSC